jgi:hypothetical protein
VSENKARLEDVATALWYLGNGKGAEGGGAIENLSKQCRDGLHVIASEIGTSHAGAICQLASSVKDAGKLIADALHRIANEMQMSRGR